MPQSAPQTTTPTPNPSPPIPSLRHATLSDLSCALYNHSITSQQLVRAYASRIAEVNPEYAAVIELNPDALSSAALLDAQPRRSILHAIPILLKDNIPTLDRTSTCAGSLVLLNARPSQEASVVTALRKAGAVILGKGNMAEWSGFRSTSGCSGWSARGGQGKGLFVEGMKSSGSSGGCASAVALGLCGVGIGTETYFSIVSPAEKAGIIGYKPTRELISSRGIIGASKRLDTVGLLTRCVSDAVQTLIEIVYYSEHHTVQTKTRAILSMSLACLKVDLSGVRIGVPWHISDFKTLHQDKVEPFKRALEALEQAGATIVHDVVVSGADKYEAMAPTKKQIILDTDMKVAINEYLDSLAANPMYIHDLQELIDLTKVCPGEEYPQRNVEGLERAQATHPDNQLYRDMLAADEDFVGEGGVEAALTRHRCDVLLVPTLSVTLQTFAAKAGSPVLSVPMGSFAEDTEVEVDEKNGLINIAPGIPFSAYIFGRATKDNDVLKVGYVFEQLTKAGESLRPYLESETELMDVRSSRFEYAF